MCDKCEKIRESMVQAKEPLRVVITTREGQDRLVASMSQDGVVRIHENDPDILRAAVTVIAQGLSQAGEAEKHARLQQELFTVALGAIGERMMALGVVEEARAAGEAKQEEPLFAQATPVGGVKA